VIKAALASSFVLLLALPAAAQTSARGDVNGDGVPDIITGASAGGAPQVKVVDGKTGQTIRQFMSFAPGFTGGVNVAAGDVNGDGAADIVTGAGAGAGPHVKVFDGKTGSVLRAWMAYEAGYQGGVRVAAGDQNGDGAADIVTTAAGTGAGGPAHVKVFSGKDGSLLSSSLAKPRPRP
jgi:fibronectin-binding autotransporter adhesin